MSLLTRSAGLEREGGTLLEGARSSAAVREGEAVAGSFPGQRRASLFPQCANPRCASGWLHLWRSREAPVFEGGWCCSAECTTALIEAALAREMDGRGSPREGYRHRIPLGLAMLRLGWITPADLRVALSAQRSAGAGRLGYWLVRQRATNEGQVTRALGLQWGCPVLALDSQSPESLTALLPRLFVDAFGALPLRIAAGRILYLGFEDRIDTALAFAVERMTGLRVESGVVEESVFRAAHARMLDAQFPRAELMEAATPHALVTKFARTIERTRPREARLVRVHDCFWLRMWKRPQGEPLPDHASVCDLIASSGAH
jgi:hypothetical protein